MVENNCSQCRKTPSIRCCPWIPPPEVLRHRLQKSCQLWAGFL